MSSSKRELLGAPLAEDAGNVTVRIKCFPTNMVYRPGTYCVYILYVRTFFCSFVLFFTQPLLSCITSLFTIHFFLLLSYLSVLFFSTCLSSNVIILFYSTLSLSLPTTYLFTPFYILHLHLPFALFCFF